MLALAEYVVKGDEEDYNVEVSNWILDNDELAEIYEHAIVKSTVKHGDEYFCVVYSIMFNDEDVENEAIKSVCQRCPLYLESYIQQDVTFIYRKGDVMPFMEIREFDFMNPMRNDFIEIMFSNSEEKFHHFQCEDKITDMCVVNEEMVVFTRGDDYDNDEGVEFYDHDFNKLNVSAEEREMIRSGDFIHFVEF